MSRKIKMLVGRKLYQSFEVVVDADGDPFWAALEAAYEADMGEWDDDRDGSYEVYACRDREDKVHYFNDTTPKITVTLNAWEEE